jgi:hypothetical protein
VNRPITLTQNRIEEAYLLVHIQLPEDLGSIKKMLILEDPKALMLATRSAALSREHALLPVERQ